MKILLWGTCLFSLGFSIHLIIWKIRIPLKQTPKLLKIFLVFLLYGLFMFLGASEYVRLLGLQISSLSFSEYIHISIFLHSCNACIHIILFSY